MAKPKTQTVTYFGRRCEVTTILLAGKHGERVIRHRWIDQADERNGSYPAGTVTSRTVTGNPLKGTFRTLVECHIVQDER